MAIFQFSAFALLATSVVLLIRSYRPEIALQVSIITGVMLLVYLVTQVSGVLDSLRALAERYGLSMSYIGILVRIIGIAYLAQFAGEICKDAGESAMASKVELGGRIMILAAALPAAVSLLELVASMLPVNNK
ncbi:MAG TPA: stage III sporulation protein AD [Clostridia bacterium]|nr:MAG: Stage III sporulation protein AC/AD protein family protein [Firmicutes bacterium ADurb.Bin356]HOF94111.1 stage III sporulation protein AD [Clostridia bacterium]